MIRHDFGYQDQALHTVYGHLSQIDVAEGQYQDIGDPLGLVGETGNVTGSHLHFEVHVNGVPQNPAGFLGRQSGDSPLAALSPRRR